MSKEMRICRRCIMDTSDPGIGFDANGVCNHCLEADVRRRALPANSEESEANLARIGREIRNAGKGKEYDCLIGISGGVDSSYIAYLVKQMELRPLVFHLDNGWNSELAVDNINKIVEKLGYDLYTHVIDWDEFRDLQRSFLKASVVDIEMLTDHANNAANYAIAKKHHIQYVIKGNNIATEFGIPRSWVWNKQDLTNLCAIHKQFGSRKLDTYPTLGTLPWLFFKYFGRRRKYIQLLNHVVYTKKEAKAVLTKELGWRDYGGKHYESLFTKFYQAHILPEKFGIDKRKPHLSSLIRNGEMDREEALRELEEPLYDSTDLANDKEYVLKKLGFSPEEFEEIMKMPPRPHSYYPSDAWVLRFLGTLQRIHERIFAAKD